MKPLILLLAVIAFACSQSNVKSSVKTHPVPTYFATEKNPSADTNKYKSGDVEVFKLVSGKDTIYFTRMYRLDNNEIRSYETTLTGNYGYDAMNYNWLNDSTITFTLINSSNKNSQEITIMGSGATTSVR